MKKITSPFSDEVIADLRAGDQVLISGTLYTARDAAHQRLIDALKRKQELPFDPRGQTVYYMGPTPPPPGGVIGSAGPTTSGRMDSFTPRLLTAGLKGMVGKGSRSPEVKRAIKKHGAVYFAATGGAGALIARSIKAVEMVAYEDLGTEAIRKLTVEDLPAIVVNDIHGGDLYEESTARYRRVPA